MQILRLTPASILDPHGAVFAAIAHHNFLDSLAVDAPLPAPRLVIWSGWFGRADPARAIFPRDFRTWTPQGWSGLARACDALLPTIASTGMQLLLRPHARHVLADPQSCLSFFRGREHQPLRLLLDPASLFAEAMLPTAEEHLSRIFGALGAHPATAAVLLANVQRTATPDDALLTPAPLHRGLIDPALILSAWRTLCPPDLPCILLDAEFEAQAALVPSVTSPSRR